MWIHHGHILMQVTKVERSTVGKNPLRSAMQTCMLNGTGIELELYFITSSELSTQ